MNRSKPDKLYEDPILARVYDSTCVRSEDTDFYLSLVEGQHLDVLDIGCGTGVLCNELAAIGNSVVGVDPSRSMLELAKAKKNGSNVEWIEAFAQDFRIDKRFDLICMTGHAFQALKDDSDVKFLFENVQQHLKPTGKFAFESRNPYIDWAEIWDGQRSTWKLGTDPIPRLLTITNATTSSIEFDEEFQFSDKSIRSKSTLRFMNRAEIDGHLGIAGLRILDLYGDWKGDPYQEKSSFEMIFVTTPKST